MTNRSPVPRTLALLPILMAALACGGGGEKVAEAPATGEPRADAPKAVEDAPLADGAYGKSEIRGSVRFEGKVPTLRPLAMDADPGCAKKHTGPVPPDSLVMDEQKRLSNVFVRVKSGLPAGRYPAPAEPVVLDQVGCRYVPHIAGVLIDQPFKILNSDGLLHNVHALPKVNSGFNRAMPAAVAEVEYTFSREEFMFRVKCDVHPWMGAYVTVMPHPFFGVSGSDGGYGIAGLPGGTYEIEAWHEKLGVQTAQLTVADGETATLNFTFSR